MCLHVFARGCWSLQVFFVFFCSYFVFFFVSLYEFVRVCSSLHTGLHMVCTCFVLICAYLLFARVCTSLHVFVRVCTFLHEFARVFCAYLCLFVLICCYEFARVCKSLFS